MHAKTQARDNNMYIAQKLCAGYILPLVSCLGSHLDQLEPKCLHGITLLSLTFFRRNLINIEVILRVCSCCLLSCKILQNSHSRTREQSYILHCI